MKVREVIKNISASSKAKWVGEKEQQPISSVAVTRKIIPLCPQAVL